MVSKKALKAYNIQKKLFPPNHSPEILPESKPVVVEPKIDYWAEHFKYDDQRYRMNHKKLSLLLSTRIFLFVLTVSLFFFLITL